VKITEIHPLIVWVEGNRPQRRAVGHAHGRGMLMLPMIIVSIPFQRHFVAVITAGAVK
jgi:ABC-type maltose transport system permease subunit